MSKKAKETDHLNDELKDREDAKLKATIDNENLPEEEENATLESDPSEKLKMGDSLLQEQLARASKEASEFRDKYYRVLAESENIRKRLSKEKQDLISYAVDNFICDILEPLDNFENALGFTDNLSDELKNWAIGFKMIAEQFQDILSNHGVRPFESVGHQFDPHLHEAIETEERPDLPEGQIIAEITKGYKHNDKVVRVSRVKVAKASIASQKEPEASSADQADLN